MTARRTVLTRLLRGFKRTGIIAITSRCNCRCQMCNIYENEPVDMRYSDIVKILDFMAVNKFLIVYFTGGEPSLHPNLVEIVKYADRLGLVTSLTTNGTIPCDTLIELKKAGLYTLSVSIDSWDPAIAEGIRRHKGIWQKQRATFETARDLGVKTYGLTYLGAHLAPSDMEKMVAYVNFCLGVPFGFCYPVMTNVNTYRLGQSASVNSPETTKRIVETLLALKKSGYRIANTAASMQDIIRFHNGQTSVFPCKGGEHVFYIDWFGDVYPCFMKSRLFNVLKEEKPIFLRNVRCNDCLIDCFREPSLLAYILSPRLIIKELAHSPSLKGIVP